jgi:hypothetical protein
MVCHPQKIEAMTKEQRAKAGAAGGKASGDCKRRPMNGMKIGRNSAGRSDSRGFGFKGPAPDRYFDVLTACREWLAAHEDPWTKYEFMPTNYQN